MNRVLLEQLSDLVLVDIVAALPMWAAVRLAQLGNRRLQAISCRRWVLKRMTDVHFIATVKAYQAGGVVRKAFCSAAVLKRLHGRINNLRYQLNGKGVIRLMHKVPGHLFLDRISHSFVVFLKEAPEDIRSRIIYLNTLHRSPLEVNSFPNLIVSYSIVPSRLGVSYRPALLNARHHITVVNALREDVRREATLKALNVTRLSGENTGGVWSATYEIKSP